MKLFTSLIEQLKKIFYNLFKNNDDFLKNLNERDNFELSQLLIKQLEIINQEMPNKKIIILLDSLDQLKETDSSNLNWLPSKYPLNTKFIYSFLNDNEFKIKDEFTKMFSYTKDDLNCIEISNLSLEDANKMFFIHNGNKRTKQFNIIQDLFKKTKEILPMYIKLMANIASHWPSYHIPNEDVYELTNIKKCISYIFKNLERDFGKLLLERCLYFLTKSQGLSDNELEDVLALDEELLDHVFELQPPPVGKFPITLWHRVKFYLDPFITTKESDEVLITCW